MKQIVLIVFTALLLAGCKKSNIGDYESYVGVWNNTSGTTTRTITIKSNGKSSYEEISKSGNTTKTVNYDGKFILEETTLKIGFKKLTVNKQPTLTNNNWQLTIDNIDYTGK